MLLTVQQVKSSDMSNSLNSALAFQQVTALATMHPCKKQHAINH